MFSSLLILGETYNYNRGVNVTDEPGYKVTVKDVHSEVIFMKEDLLPKIWKSQNDICRKLDKYNGLHEKVNKLKSEVREDKELIEGLIQSIETTKTKEETEADVLQRISEEKEKVRKAEHDKFMRLLKVIAVIIGIAGLLAAYVW